MSFFKVNVDLTLSPTPEVAGLPVSPFRSLDEDKGGENKTDVFLILPPRPDKAMPILSPFSSFDEDELAGLTFRPEIVTLPSAPLAPHAEVFVSPPLGTVVVALPYFADHPAPEVDRELLPPLKLARTVIGVDAVPLIDLKNKLYVPATLIPPLPIVESLEWGYDNLSFSPVPDADTAELPGPPVHPLMPGPMPLLSLTELTNLNIKKSIDYLKKNPANLDVLLSEILADTKYYNNIIKGLGVKFWCDWCQDTSDDEKAARTALLNTGLPEELKAKAPFKALSFGKKRASGTRATTAKSAKNTVDAPSAAVVVVAVAPPVQLSDDASFDFDTNLFASFDDMDWSLLDGMSAGDFSSGVPALDELQEGSSVAQARGGSAKRSNAAPADGVFRKKRMLMPDSETENIPMSLLQYYFQKWPDKQQNLNVLTALGVRG